MKLLWYKIIFFGISTGSASEVVQSASQVSLWDGKGPGWLCFAVWLIALGFWWGVRDWDWCPCSAAGKESTILKPAESPATVPVLARTLTSATARSLLYLEWPVRGGRYTDVGNLEWILMRLQCLRLDQRYRIVIHLCPEGEVDRRSLEGVLRRRFPGCLVRWDLTGSLIPEIRTRCL